MTILTSQSQGCFLLALVTSEIQGKDRTRYTYNPKLQGNSKDKLPKSLEQLTLLEQKEISETMQP